MEELILYELKIPKYKINTAVASSDLIKKIVYQIHADYGCRGSDWPWKNAMVYKDKKPFAYVSYNGRIFTGFNDVKSEVTF